MASASEIRSQNGGRNKYCSQNGGRNEKGPREPQRPGKGGESRKERAPPSDRRPDRSPLQKSERPKHGWRKTGGGRGFQRRAFPPTPPTRQTKQRDEAARRRWKALAVPQSLQGKPYTSSGAALREPIAKRYTERCGGEKLPLKPRAHTGGW